MLIISISYFLNIIFILIFYNLTTNQSDKKKSSRSKNVFAKITTTKNRFNDIKLLNVVEVDGFLNDNSLKNLFEKIDLTKVNLTSEVAKSFRRTTINVDVIANDLLNEAVKDFRSTTMKIDLTNEVVKSFRLTATIDCLTIDCLTTSCLTTTNCKRSKSTIITCMTFSYFFISSTTFFNFDKLR